MIDLGFDKFDVDLLLNKGVQSLDKLLLVQ